MKPILAVIVSCVFSFQLHAQVSFKLSSSPVVGTNPFGVTAADVNGDGKVDLISANFTYGDTLTVLTNNRSGNFETSGTYTVGNAPTWVTAVDVNGDGKVDLISVNWADRTLTVLTNSGSGGFATSGTYAVGSYPTELAAADVNGDGKVDLICANSGDGTLTVLTNNGSGHFALSSTLSVGTSVSVTAADVNGDGKMDLINANYGNNALLVLTNNGSGGFVTSGTYAVGTHPVSVTAADVNGDGKLDLICADGNSNTLTVLTNATPFPPPSCDPAPLGLVSWWPGEGNADDIVGTNNGILQGGVTFAPGEVGQAFVLDGFSGSIRVPASPSLDVGQSGGFTVEAWINPANLNLQELFEWNQNNGVPYGAGQIGVHMEINESSGDGSFWGDIVDTTGTSHYFNSATGLITTNVFQDLAMTYDKTTGLGVLYRNGIVVATANLGVFTPQTSFDFFMGNRPSGFFTGIYFHGEMDEPTIYNRALSIHEIAAIYNAGRAGKCSTTTPPVLISEPTSQTVLGDGTASFSVMATGAMPLNYQWSLNGTNILGATSSNLTISSVSQSDLGVYTVAVSNLFGNVVSSNAMLSMYPFLAMPFGGVVTDWGQNTILSVQAWGTGPLSYQWYDNGKVIPNATNSSLTFSAIQFTNAGSYSVVVSSSLGGVTNTAAQVVVNPAGVSLGLYPGITVTGTVGYTYDIQSNPDLTNTNGWTTVASLTLFQPVQLWVDINNNAASPTNAHRFYRVLPGQ
jgi:concanavalin A-like lectin/glucanase superfamily protein/VCBS repeat protein/Ig-like domain-containing protein/FG-GAP repeat protein